MSDSHEDVSASLVVHSRLKLTLSYLSTLQSVAILVDEERAQVPMLGDPDQFAAWVGRMSDVMHRHIKAVAAALPHQCYMLDAPLIEE
jgi:hypothetical protein